MDYRRHVIRTRSKNGKFEKNHVEACLVVGSLVEASLKRAYRPRPGTLPKPLVLQKAEHFPTATLKDVRPPGYERAVPTFDVQAHVDDGKLALCVTKDGVSTLQQPPYNLEVNAADHTGSSSCPTAHDVLMSTRLGVRSCLTVGLYSIEFRCREVESIRAFPWESTLTDEAMPLWLAEQSTEHGADLQGRILIFACFPKPCHAGSMSLHASICHRGSDKWKRLWGWDGFKQTPPTSLLESEIIPKRTSVSVRPSPTPQQKWNLIRSRLSESPDGWVKISQFLDVLGLPAG